tara:strand:- start:2581 stop:2700 length:120 start_codon:yes stop_codon:yes gene_type:complete
VERRKVINVPPVMLAGELSLMEKQLKLIGVCSVTNGKNK